MTEWIGAAVGILALMVAGTASCSAGPSLDFAAARNTNIELHLR